MKHHEGLGAIALVVIALAAIGGCEDEDSNALVGRSAPRVVAPEETIGGEKNTFDHAHESIGGENGVTDIKARQKEEAAIGPPEVVATLHGVQKISYAALGKMLGDFGVVLTPTAGGSRPPMATGSLTAAELYTDGKNALGAPVYASRTPEMMVPSTSALAKEYDIFLAAAPEIIANIAQSKRCPGVVLVENAQLTTDGISCLMGKPATPEHVALANKMIAEATDQAQGTSIAVATILAAAHISE